MHHMSCLIYELNIVKHLVLTYPRFKNIVGHVPLWQIGNSDLLVGFQSVQQHLLSFQWYNVQVKNTTQMVLFSKNIYKHREYYLQ